MLFAAALVASVPCDGSPALACEVNTLAPANSSSVWALMGGHDIKLYQPVSDVLTVTMGRGQVTRARAAAAELAAALQQWWLPATRCGNGGARAKGRRRATLLIGGAENGGS